MAWNPFPDCFLDCWCESPALITYLRLYFAHPSLCAHVHFQWAAGEGRGCVFIRYRNRTLLLGGGYHGACFRDSANSDKSCGLPDIGDGEERARKQRAPETERGLDTT
jgi:hypothetical protein